MSAPADITLSADRPAWQARAACLAAPDPDRFYAGPFDEVIDEHCDGCAVRTDCLLDALDRGDREGVWGGTTPDQRAAIASLARGAAA